MTLGYDGLGRRASISFPNGTRTTTYAYDLASRLTARTHATNCGVPFQSFLYGLDAADAQTSLTTLDQALTFGYDLATRLTEVAATPEPPTTSTMARMSSSRSRPRTRAGRRRP